MLGLIVLLVVLVPAAIWFAHRRGYSFDAGAARALASVAAVFGLALAAFIGVQAARTASDGVHTTSDVVWIAAYSVVAALAGTLLLVGCVVWRGKAAWMLRLAGFVGLVLATLGTLSWVLVLFTPLALLAVPSLAADGRRSSGGRERVATG